MPTSADANAVEPDGWSRTNLLYMRKAAEAWPTEPELVHHVGGQLPWRHVTVLLAKDPYVFEHLGLVQRLAERDVEQALMGRLQDTLLELGRRMAFVGRQVRLSVPGTGVMTSTHPRSGSCCAPAREPTVRYSLAAPAAPVAVTDYHGLPEDARAALPSVEELQAVVDDELAPGGARRTGPTPTSASLLSPS